MDEMKKLIIDGQEFEVVDAAGRQRITVLENTTPSGGGLSITEKNLILQLFNKAAYAEDDAGTAYETLSNLWTGSYHSVAWEGAGYTHGNSDVAVEDGESFTSTVTANNGKTIESVTVTMGGETVQGAYSSGTITIANVTGDIVITVTTAQMTVSSISAVYTQSGTVYDTDSLDSLKANLVVTATFPDSSTAIIPDSDYTLSGTLLEGTSSITVSYGGKTASFNVTVTHSAIPSGYTAYDYIYKSTSGNPTPIVTDAQLTSDYSLEMEFMIPTGSTSYATPILGTRSQQYGGVKQFALFITQTTGKLGYWHAGKDTTTNITITNDVVHTIKVLPVGKSTTYPSNAVIDVDGTEYNTTSNTTGQTWSAWFGIFGYAYSATEATAGAQNFMRIGEIIIKDANDDVVYDFVPVSRNDNKNGFYETVNGTFYEATSMTVGNWE